MNYSFHAHIYFEANTQDSAQKFQDLIQKSLSSNVRYVGKLINRPIGPHPLPMFEIDFDAEHFTAVSEFLSKHRGSHSILIHPQSGNDLLDHTENAIWLGTKLPLNLSML